MQTVYHEAEIEVLFFYIECRFGQIVSHTVFTSISQDLPIIYSSLLLKGKIDVLLNLKIYYSSSQYS